MKLSEMKINVLGDSITEGIGVSCPENCFTSIISRETGAVCRNYGICGTRIARQQVPSADPRIDLYFASRVEEMDPDANVILIFGGTNDFGHGDAPIGNMDDRTVDTFYGALHVLYRSLIEKYPEAKIVVMTPLHRRNEMEPLGDGNKARPTILFDGYVKIIREVAEYYSLPILDLYAASGLQPNIPIISQKFVPDRLHPNDAGHRILAELMIAFLKRMYCFE